MLQTLTGRDKPVSEAPWKTGSVPTECWEPSRLLLPTMPPVSPGGTPHPEHHRSRGSHGPLATLQTAARPAGGDTASLKATHEPSLLVNPRRFLRTAPSHPEPTQPWLRGQTDAKAGGGEGECLGFGEARGPFCEPLSRQNFFH